MKDLRGMYKNRKGSYSGQDLPLGYRALPVIRVTEQDNAVVGTVKGWIAGDYEEISENLIKCMERIAVKVEEAGGVIGHMKAYVREEARECMISLTSREDIQKKAFGGGGGYVEAVQIVFGISTVQMQDFLEKDFGMDIAAKL